MSSQDPVPRGSKKGKRRDSKSLAEDASQSDEDALLLSTEDAYERVRIKTLPLHHNHRFRQQSITVALPFYLGRVNMARLWWKSCQACSAYEDSQQVFQNHNWRKWTPSQYCSEHCRPLAEKIQQVSREMVCLETNGNVKNCAMFQDLIRVTEGEGKKTINIGEENGGRTLMSLQVEFLSWGSTVTETPKKRKHKGATPTPEARDTTTRMKTNGAGWQKRLRPNSPASVADQSSEYVFPATEVARKIRQSKESKKPKSLKFPEPDKKTSKRKPNLKDDEDTTTLDSQAHDKSKQDQNIRPRKEDRNKSSLAKKPTPSKTKVTRDRQLDFERVSKSQHLSPNVPPAKQDVLVTPRKTNLTKPPPQKHSKPRRELFSQETPLPVSEVLVEQGLPTQSTLSQRSRSTASISCSRGVDGQQEQCGRLKRKLLSWGDTQESGRQSPLGTKQGTAKSGSSKATGSRFASKQNMDGGEAWKKRKNSQLCDESETKEQAKEDSSQESSADEYEAIRKKLQKISAEEIKKQRGQQAENSQASKDEGKNGTRNSVDPAPSSHQKPLDDKMEKQSQTGRYLHSASPIFSQCATAMHNQKNQSFQPLQIAQKEASSSSEAKHTEFEKEHSSGLSLSKSPVIHCEQQSQPNENRSSQYDSDGIYSREESNNAVRPQDGLAVVSKLPSVSFKGLTLKADTGTSFASSTRSKLQSQLSQAVQSQMNPPGSQRLPGQALPFPKKSSFMLDIDEASQSSGSCAGGVSSTKAGSQPVQVQLRKYQGGSCSEDSDDSSALPLPCCEKQPSTQTSLVLFGRGMTPSQRRDTASQPRDHRSGEKAHQMEHWENLQRTGAGKSKASRALIDLVVEMNRERSDSEPFWLPSLLDDL